MTSQVSSTRDLSQRLSVWFIGIATNAVLGAVTILIDTQISRFYFKRYFEMRFELCIKAGLLIGALFGGAAAMIFVDKVASSASTPGGYRLALRHVNAIALIAFGGWVLGGYATTFLTVLTPRSLPAHFHDVPQVDEILGSAWVNGSSWGMMLGWLISPALALAMVRRSFLRMQQLSTRNAS